MSASLPTPRRFQYFAVIPPGSDFNCPSPGERIFAFMYTNGKNFDDLDLDVLKDWKSERVEESRTLDFKRDAYSLDTQKEAPKRAFAADVSGFANAGGGVILLGVEEERGESGHGSRFGQFVGANLEGGFDRYQQQAQDMIKAAIEPRGIAFRIKQIPADHPDKPVVAIGIERSARAPHRLRSYGSADFFLRGTRSVDPMDIDQVREAFRRTFTVLADAEARLEDAERRTDRVPTKPDAFFWAAITPTFPTPFLLPTRDRRLRELLGQMLKFRPDLSGIDVGYNVHGAFAFTSRDGRSTPVFRIQRDGTLERIERLFANIEPRTWKVDDKTLTENRTVIAGSYLALTIARTYKDFEEVRAALGITGPALLTAGVRGIRGCELRMLTSYSGMGTPQAFLPRSPATNDAEFLRPRLETSDENLKSSFKEVADFFWNVWGYDECNGFDEEGNITPTLASWPWTGRPL